MPTAFWEIDRFAFLREMRRDLMLGKPPESLDPIEAAIHL
jgi:hypothetical protein